MACVGVMESKGIISRQRHTCHGSGSFFQGRVGLAQSCLSCPSVILALLDDRCGSLHRMGVNKIRKSNRQTSVLHTVVRRAAERRGARTPRRTVTLRRRNISTNKEPVCGHRQMRVRRQHSSSVACVHPCERNTKEVFYFLNKNEKKVNYWAAEDAAS